MKETSPTKSYEAVQINQKQRARAAIARPAEAEDRFAESYPDSAKYIASLMDEMVKKAVRKLLVVDRKRADGRAMDELRPITCEIDILPMTHGSALFTRGETQSLGVTTLGMIGLDDQMMDGLKLDEPSKRFILHYNFPPYSVGEVRPMRGPGRREIGHGALAERSLRAVFPDDESFPYVVRQVSDILKSNGSSSMASVCSGSLSMMAAGVPVKKAVAGIAMGLIADAGQVCILTDIQGLEDHYGDMDFKVAGTRDGVTALLLGAFILHGIQPGPNMFTKQGVIAYSIILGCLVANIFLYPIGLFLTRAVAKIVQVRYTYLAPVIIIFCFAGAFAATGNTKELVLTAAILIFSYLLVLLDISSTPLMLGMILADIMEMNFVTSMMSYDRDYLIFFKRPISCVILILTVVLVISMIRINKKVEALNQAQMEEIKKEQETIG